MPSVYASRSHAARRSVSLSCFDSATAAPGFHKCPVLDSCHEEDRRCFPARPRLCLYCLCRCPPSPPASSPPSSRRIDLSRVRCEPLRSGLVPERNRRISCQKPQPDAAAVCGLSGISLGAVTSGTIARRGIVLHSGHEEDCRSGPFAGLRPSGVCLEAQIPAKAESPQSSASGPSAESKSGAPC